MEALNSSGNRFTGKELESLIDDQFEIIESLKREIEKHYSKIDFLNNLIAQGHTFSIIKVEGTGEEEQELVDEVYNTDWSWYNKAIFILRTKNRILTIKQIAVEIKKLEPSIELTNAQTAITNALALRLDKTVHRVKLAHSSEFFYGLINWFDSNDNPKAEYFTREYFIK